MTNETTPTPRPWYTEPMMWLVVGLPASVVVAGLVTAWIAVQGADAVLTEKSSARAPRALNAERVPAQENTHVVNPR